MMPNNQNLPAPIGKIRGLSACATEAGVFTILALDHRQSLVRMFAAETDETLVYEQVVAAKSAVVRALAPSASAMLLDPVYGAAQSIASGSLPGNSGLLVAVEESGYQGPKIARRSNLLADWSVSKIKHMGADAVKLLIYYHPETGELAASQEQLVRDVLAAGRAADIAVFVEPLSYSIDPDISKDSELFAASRPRMITDLAHRIGALQPDVLKLEFPVDWQHDRDERSWLEACEAVSIAAPCPWVVLSAGVGFDTFARQVEMACRAGASGFIAGRAIWQESVLMEDFKRKEWLEKVAAKRMQILNEIANQHARPWFDFYPDLSQSVAEDWYRHYG